MNLTCFKAYDIRGIINLDIDEQISYRIGRAVAQHLKAKNVIVGYDARETSPVYARFVSEGVKDFGANVIDIGMTGTEEMYWAVTEFGACAGIEVTASHNPINYNGMKIVKKESQPLDYRSDFSEIKKLAESENWIKVNQKGTKLTRAVEARSAYVSRILNFVDLKLLKPLKIVMNSGNGAAGPTFNYIAKMLYELKAPLEFVHINQKPDHTFPNGIPNPILKKNHASTAKIVQEVGADFGVAFDGDFDRCFFFDEDGAFVGGEYVVSLLASIFLKKEKKATIVHDPRVIWNIKDTIGSGSGIAVQSKTGHAYMKEIMRSVGAVYGGEISSHHYFRDFAYCDSGMIPWILVAELISISDKSLKEWIKEWISAYPSSGELNFEVKSSEKAIRTVLAYYSEDALSVDNTDGISLEFVDWRFNLRSSNTEPIVRLNVESRNGYEKLTKNVAVISRLLKGH